MSCCVRSKFRECLPRFHQRTSGSNQHPEVPFDTFICTTFTRIISSQISSSWPNLDAIIVIAVLVQWNIGLLQHSLGFTSFLETLMSMFIVNVLVSPFPKFDFNLSKTSHLEMVKMGSSKSNVNVTFIIYCTHLEMVEMGRCKSNVNVNVPGDEVGQLDCTQATPRLNLAETLWFTLIAIDNSGR